MIGIYGPGFSIKEFGFRVEWLTGMRIQVRI